MGRIPMTDEQKKAFAEKMRVARAKARGEQVLSDVPAEPVGEASGTPGAAPLTEADTPAIDTAQEETSDPVVVEEAKDQEAEAELAQPEVPSAPEPVAPAQEEAPAPEPAPIVDDGSVLLRSADGRSLQASIGESVWEGKEIRVPAHQAADVRSLLENGGFFLKD